MLIGAGVLAARGRLDLTTVLVVAWVAATAGGIIGWLGGLKAKVASSKRRQRGRGAGFLAGGPELQ